MIAGLQVPTFKTPRFNFRKPSALSGRKPKRGRALPQCGIRTKAQQVEWDRCAADVVYWLNAYCRTYDPRLLPGDPLVPFRTFPRQEEFLQWLSEGEALQEDGLADKSRDVGFTYLCCAYALHGWLFRTGFAAGFGSRKLELVDKLGDPDTIFEKLRILRRSLPAWQLPKGFKEEEHDNFCRLINPETGATLTGEGGDEIGRGGRKTVYFVDEYAFLPHPDLVDRALSQTTRCVVRFSTPNGPGNAFYRKRHSGNIRVFTFHWKQDPRKNRYAIYDADGNAVAEGQGEAPTCPPGGRVVYPWYEKECARLDDPVAVAQELDIDYSASLEGVCIPARWVKAAVDFDLEPTGDRTAGLDIAEEGSNKTVLAPRCGPKVEPFRTIPNGNTTQTAWKVRDAARELEILLLKYDADGPGMGVKGTWAEAAEPLGFEVQGVHGGTPAPETLLPDGKKACEKFANLRSYLWCWCLRKRFKKTYEARVLGIAHPPEECISIPNDPALIADLSLPLMFTTDLGKTALESKKAMARRGVKSPDHGDALAYSEAPVTKKRALEFHSL